MAYLNLKLKTVDGFEYQFIQKQDAVAVLIETAIDGVEHILVTKQFRIGPNVSEDVITFMELPAGNIDYGETPVHAAEREIYEETNLIMLTPPEFLGYYYSSPGCMTERIYLYYYFVSNPQSVEKYVTNSEERIENAWIPKKQAIQLSDPKMLSALAFAFLEKGNADV